MTGLVRTFLLAACAALAFAAAAQAPDPMASSECVAARRELDAAMSSAGAAAAASPTPLPPVAFPRAPAITTCDAAGCWDSDGRHHQQVGPMLAGPRGVCTVQGGLLVCP